MGITFEDALKERFSQLILDGVEIGEGGRSFIVEQILDVIDRNLPRLYEALGMKRVCYGKTTSKNTISSLSHKSYDYESKYPCDTHAFWMTAPVEICSHENKDVDTSQVLTSNPPQYRWKCKDCDKTGYIFCDDYKPLEEEKVECENYWHLLTHMIKATENKYGYSLLKHDSCPSCGQKLTEGEE